MKDAALRQSAGVTPTQVSVADHHLARRNRRAALFALCSPARSPGASRRDRTAPGGMAADRVARGREGADQILALDLAGRHRICGLWILPNCAGASNATIRNSSRRSGSDISKVAGGATSTTTEAVPKMADLAEAVCYSYLSTEQFLYRAPLRYRQFLYATLTRIATTLFLLLIRCGWCPL